MAVLCIFKDNFIILEKSTLDHPVSVEIYLTSAVNSSLPRYTVTLVDTKKSDFTSKRNGKYAVFIVPQGWLSSFF